MVVICFILVLFYNFGYSLYASVQAFGFFVVLINIEALTGSPFY